MKIFDLHLHSNISSDGELKPEELMRRCHAEGLEIVAITDHNSAKAYTKAKPIAAQLGLSLIPAIELDAIHEGQALHILGYNIDPNDEAIQANDEAVRELERANSLELMEKVEALGIHFDRKKVYELSVDGIVVAEMIAEVALSDLRNDAHPLLENLRPGKPGSDNPYVNFYWELCSQGKPAWVPMEYIKLDEAINLITNSGGVPVLAHPGKNIGTDRDLAIEIMKQGIKGIEAYSSYHDPKTTTFYLELAEELGAFVTAGSDFHGKNKPSIVPGGVEVKNEEKLVEAFKRKMGRA